ncbi:TonB-dependent siderophore receptor [Qingshengfaniella alkalisoli]|uniref:TonB-dependent siderophore receptor n=1 Tax=Qingshengfaniella alkalisoli TaxID=2599296 RepID=A0A5B8J0E2_9RHOB|nr:TonB-dependent siderophore receptor [Qingshengfaniella alkalisoli]QDY70651.1 TonB-dependent siderophore receptor [Qingshengfaniella alkalisoli]
MSSDTFNILNGSRTRSASLAMLLGCTALVAVPTGLHAQSAETSDEPFRLAPIIISVQGEADDDVNSVVAKELWVGGKVATSILDTPASVSVVTEKEIEERDAETLEEVLQYSPGIITDYYGSDDRNDYFLIRGFQATTYRDGMTLGSMRGVREEPFAYERIEVIRGSNSTLFGTADPGGSVNFVSKQPKFETFSEGYLSYGSFDHAELGVDFGDTLNAEQTLAYRFTAKLQQSDLEYDHSQDDETFLMGGVTWEPTDYTSLSVIVDHLNREGTPNSGGYPLDKEYDRSDFFGEPDFNYHDVERTSVSALFTHDFGTGLIFRANARYSDLTDDFGYVYLYDFEGRTGTVLDRYYFGTDSSAEELIGNAILQYDTSFDRFDSSTLLGLEYRNASTEDTSYYGPAASIDVANPVYSGKPDNLDAYQERKNDYSTQSVFLQQNVSFDDRFIATLGVRHDWMELASKGQTYGAAFDDSDDFSETSFRGALTYKVTDEISTYASYVESVAPPSIGVDPERGEQYELGVKYEPLGYNALFSASIYDLTKRDVTIAVVQSDGRIERETVGESRVRGIDLEGKAELSENLSVIGSYSYLDSEVVRAAALRDGTEIEGNQFASTPNHIASLWVNYTVPGNEARGDMTFGLGARYIGSYYFNAANTSKSDATTTFDAALTYQIMDDTDLAINVSNLLDEQHVVGSGTANYYSPSRSISATLRHRW